MSPDVSTKRIRTTLYISTCNHNPFFEPSNPCNFMHIGFVYYIYLAYIIVYLNIAIIFGTKIAIAPNAYKRQFSFMTYLLIFFIFNRVGSSLVLWSIDDLGNLQLHFHLLLFNSVLLFFIVSPSSDFPLELELISFFSSILKFKYSKIHVLPCRQFFNSVLRPRELQAYIDS